MNFLEKLKFGLIADGNRRWAKEKNLTTSKGHRAGFETIKNIILPALYNHADWDHLVIYAFSTENWKRSPSEVSDLMKLFSEITAWLEDLHKKEIRFIHAGKKNRLDPRLRKKIEDAEAQTAHHQKFTVTICLDYGSQDEIERAVTKHGTDFYKHLEVPTLDLILRTGGEHRLSNFCLWQAAYSEFIFSKKMLPELNKEDIGNFLDEFENRQRRKGA